MVNGGEISYSIPAFARLETTSVLPNITRIYMSEYGVILIVSFIGTTAADSGSAVAKRISILSANIADCRYFVATYTSWSRSN